jgi:signal transduction histidine kinase
MGFTMTMMLLSYDIVAQDKVSLQVKTFDQDLKPLPNIQVALNDLDYFPVNNKGTAIVEVNQSELPIRAIRVNDEGFEAASWNLSKGTIEIIVRPVSYKIMHVSAQFADGTPLANTPVTFRGSKTISLTSGQLGKFDLPVSLHEDIQAASQFEIDNMLIADMSVNGDLISLVVERPRPKQTQPQPTVTVKPAAPQFDVNQLDSINSLAEFYAMFRNISMNGLDEDIRLLVDKKFKELVALRQDSIRASQPVFIKSISDTSLVIEDIRNLLKQATAERNTLHTNREEFENKIVVISSKLQRGVVNLSEDERRSLMQDIDVLEQLLTDNESQFYENHNDYREIINTLREKYLEVEQLQHRLSEAERLREEQDREFRQRLIGVGAVVVAFGFLIILLMTFSTRLRRQTRSLKVANERIEQINENLEVIVAKRTRLLEEANKELDIFLYRASHDLRTPVLSLMGLTQIIEHVDREELVQHVRLATENMNSVLNKLVDISEISQEAKNDRTINVLETINTVRNKHLVLMHASGGSRRRGSTIVSKRAIQFDVDCPETLQIHTSPSLLEIILNNLVENAIFFGNLKESDESVRVEIKARINNSNLEVSVYDNGVGIANIIRPRMFTMFFAGNEGSKGSGLGLYTVKKCITALHGTITFESEEEKFTRFIVVIPPLQAPPSSTILHLK